MLNIGIKNRKRKKLIHNKEYIKELKRIFDWVEEVTIKLRLNIITEQDLKERKDIQYLNQWLKYMDLLSLVEGVLTTDTNKDIDILDKIKEFKKDF